MVSESIDRDGLRSLRYTAAWSTARLRSCFIRWLYLAVVAVEAWPSSSPITPSVCPELIR